MIPHTPADEWTVTDDGLESGIMVEEQHCSLCDAVLDTRKTPNENHEHTYGDWVMIKAPTCTEKGERECVCTGCSDRKTEEVKALGYLYVSKGGDVYEFTAEKERFIGVSTFFR